MQSISRAYTVTDQWKYHEKYQKPSFKTNKFTLALILRLCKTHILMSATLELLRVFFLLLAPQVLKHLLSVLQHPTESKWDGVEYCVLLVAVGLLGAICETHTYFQLNNAGIKMKTALISALYRKSLKMIQPSGKEIHFFAIHRYKRNRLASNRMHQIAHTYLSQCL